MTDTTTETGTALALFPKLNLPSVTGITEQMNKSFGTMYTRIEAGIAELPTDMSIAKNRDAVASYAYSISRTKTGLDEAASGVSSEAKAIVDAVNAERRQLKTTLDTLRDKARAPLDAWQAAEDQRKDLVRSLSSFLTNIEIMIVGNTSAELKVMFDDVNATYIGKDMHGEDAEMLSDMLTEALKKIAHEIENAERREAEARELEQLRAEKAAREEADRIAAEKKAAEEEVAAQAERDRIERERIAQEAKETAAREAQEAIDAEKRKTEEAEAARIAAEEARQRAEEKAEADRVAAKAAAEQEAQEREERAAQKVRDEQKAEAARIERERLAQERADQERAADEAHRRKINSAAVAAVMKAASITEAEAKSVIVAIYKGQIPQVTIAY